MWKNTTNMWLIYGWHGVWMCLTCGTKILLTFGWNVATMWLKCWRDVAEMWWYLEIYGDMWLACGVMWSKYGQNVPDMSLACDWHVTDMWLICGWTVVGIWLTYGMHVVNIWRMWLECCWHLDDMLLRCG